MSHQKTHYHSSSYNYNTYSVAYIPPCARSDGDSAEILASCTISYGAFLATNATSEGAEGIQYTQTIISHTATS